MTSNDFALHKNEFDNTAEDMFAVAGDAPEDSTELSINSKAIIEAVEKAGGIDALARANSFFDIALPDGASIHMRVMNNHTQFGDFNNTSRFGVVVGAETYTIYGQKRDANGNVIKDEDEALDNMRDAFEFMAEQAEREREWDKKMFNVGGMDMTGADIDAVVDALTDPTSRAAIIAARAKKNNIPIEQAEKETDMVLKHLEIKKKIEMGIATQTERDEYNRRENDPSFRGVARDVIKLANEINTKKGSLNLGTKQDIAVAGMGQDSTDARADTLKVMSGTDNTTKIANVGVSSYAGSSINASPLTPHYNQQAVGQNTKTEVAMNNQISPNNQPRVEAALGV